MTTNPGENVAKTANFRFVPKKIRVKPAYAIISHHQIPRLRACRRLVAVKTQIVSLSGRSNIRDQKKMLCWKLLQPVEEFFLPIIPANLQSIAHVFQNKVNMAVDGNSRNGPEN